MTSVGADFVLIHLLGGFRISSGERTLEESVWRLRKARSLVKLLALAPAHRLHRDQILDLLWPDLEPTAAANNLYQALHVARRAFHTIGVAADCLRMQDDLLYLGSGDVWVDAADFEASAAEARRARSPEAYEAALRLYTGELLPEDRFEDWAVGPREALAELQRALLTELAQLYEARGDLLSAADALRRVLRTDVSDEAAHVQLMRLLALSGQRHQALRQYQRLREALHRELEVEPAPASEQLYEDIVRGHLRSPTAKSGDHASRLVGRRPAEATEEAQPALLGRARELTELDRRLDALFQGRGGLVLVGGEAGVGKSRLALEVAAHVRRRGGRVLLGAAYEQEGERPYGPFLEAFALADDPAGGDLATLVPGAAAELEVRKPPLGPGASDRQRLFRAVVGFLEQLGAASPLLVVLDDLHAADQASLELLHYLTRVGQRLPLLFLATFRPDEADPAMPLGQLLATLHRERLAARLNVERLERATSDALMRQLLEESEVDDALLAAVYELADGNPFYTEETVRALREAGELEWHDGRWRLGVDEIRVPTAVSEVIAARLIRLPDPARRMLQAAAVVGREVSYPVLRAAVDMDENRLLEALDAALGHRWLDETGDGYRFGHPLQRAALYAGLGQARRAYLHGRVAAALETTPAVNSAQQVEALAYHLSHSEQPDRSVPYLVQAGDQAAAVHANELAVAHYRRALELIQGGRATEFDRLRAETWEKLGDLYALTGDGNQDVDAYATALATLDEHGAAEQRARLHRKAAYACLMRQQLAPADAHLTAAEGLLSVSDDTAESGRVRRVRAHWLWSQRRYDEGQQLAEQSLALAHRWADPTDVMAAYVALALLFHSSGEWRRGLQLEIEQLGTALDSADPRLAQLFDVHTCLGEFHLYGDQPFDEVEGYARRTLDLASRAGARRAQALSSCLLGEALLLRGRWAEAEAALSHSQQLHEALGSAMGEALSHQRLAELAIYRGQADATAEHLRRGFERAGQSVLASHVVDRLYATAAMEALECADAARAVALIEEATGAAERYGSCPACGALLNPVAADAYARLGRAARARHYADVAVQVADQWQSESWRAMAECALGAAARADGDSDEARRRYRSAAATFERIGQVFDAARCLFEAGRLHGDGRQFTEERQALLRRASMHFHALGATPAEARAAHELAMLSAR